MNVGAVAGSAALALALATACGPPRLPDDTASRVALAVGARSSAERAVGGPTALPPATLSFVRPATPLRGANGLACRDRQLLVAEALGNRVLRVAADGSFESIPLPTGVRGPRDLAVDGTGDVYVAAAGSGEVWRQRASDGGWNVVARGLPEVSGIAIDARGRVFAATCDAHGRIVELDPEGRGTPRLVASGLGCAGSMTAVGDEALIVPLRTAGSVVRVGLADGARRTVAEGLRVPTAAKHAPDGTVVIVESATGVIRELPISNEGGGRGAERARLAPGLDGFATCGESGVASNLVTGEITVFKPWPSGPRVLERGGLAEPHGLAQAGEDLLVSDGVSLRRIRSGSVDVLATTTIDGIPPPFALAIGSGGSAWVTVPEQGEVHRIDLVERTSRKVAGGFDRPTSILATADGAVIVADTGAGRIVRIDADGSTRTLASGLVSPLGLALRGGQILTTEPTGGRVLGIREGSPPALVATALAAPGGVAADAAGHVFVAETRTGALLRLDPDGSHRKIATGFAFGDAEADPSPIAMLASSDGSILVALPSNGSIVRVKP